MAQSKEKKPYATSLRRTDLDLHELDGGAVLYDHESGAVHYFNTTTLSIWSACDKPRTVESIVDILSEQYDIDRAKSHSVVEQVLDEFRTKNLLQVGGMQSPSLDSEASNADAIRNSVEAVTPLNVTREATEPPALSEHGNAQSRGLTRRQFVRGGSLRLVLAAPVISTFFARPAYASLGISPHGPGGCKNVGFSCTVNSECCESDGTTACQDPGTGSKVCCVQHGRPGCLEDSDCCNPGDVCIANECD